MREDGYVSIWLGVAPSMDALEKFVALTYNEDGELVPSQFMVQFGLPRWNEACREAECFEAFTDSLIEVLTGFSYDSQLVEQLQTSLEKSIRSPVNAAVLLYNYNFQNPRVIESHGALQLRFFGVCKFQESAS